MRSAQLEDQVVVMLGTMFVFNFIVIVPCIPMLVLITAALAMALDFALILAFFLAFPLNLSAPITVTITIVVAGLITAALAVPVIMSGGVASVTMLRCQWKTSKRAHADCERQNPCKLP
jgi:hypothetical protein